MNPSPTGPQSRATEKPLPFQARQSKGPRRVVEEQEGEIRVPEGLDSLPEDPKSPPGAPLGEEGNPERGSSPRAQDPPAPPRPSPPPRTTPAVPPRLPGQPLAPAVPPSRPEGGRHKFDGTKPEHLGNPAVPPARTVQELLQDLNAGLIHPRDLKPKQRRACLLVMGGGRQTAAELASFFRVSTQRIREDFRTLRAEVGRDVADFGPGEALGQLVLAAERARALAYRQEDPATAWAIERDLYDRVEKAGLAKNGNAHGALTPEVLQEAYARTRAAMALLLDPYLSGVVPPRDSRKTLTLGLPGAPPGAPSGGTAGTTPQAQTKAPTTSVTPEPAADADPRGNEFEEDA